MRSGPQLLPTQTRLLVTARHTTTASIRGPLTCPTAQRSVCAAIQQQQQLGMDPSPAAAGATPHTWTKHMTAAYLTNGRNWAAVEDFYVQLVAGRQCLSAIGLSAAGQYPTGSTGQNPTQPVQQQHNPQPGEQSVPSRTARNNGTGQTRITYKLYVSYLGGSFSGWLRGNTNSKPAVQDSLSAAIAATGLCDRGDLSGRSKRAAARAARKAVKQQVTTADGASQHMAAAGNMPGCVQPDEGPTVTPTDPQAQQAAVVCDDGGLRLCVAQPDTRGGSGVPQPQQEESRQRPFLLSGGRTDAGVSAVGQVASFYSWQPVVPGDQVADTINQQLQAQWSAGLDTAAAAAAGYASHQSSREEQVRHDSSTAGSAACEALTPAVQAVLQPPPICPLRVWSAVMVPRQFHPTFAASWRRYVYLLPLRSVQTPGVSVQQLPRYTSELHKPCDLTPEQLQEVTAAPDVDPALVDALLQPLQGLRLNYTAFARDTPKDKNCDCILLHARATRVMLPSHCSQKQQVQPAGQQDAAATKPWSAERGVQDCAAHAGCVCLAVELVADRFMRRMVRVLLGTLVHEAVALQQQQQQSETGSNYGTSDQLLQLVEGQDRSATAGPAPALGLCFAAVGYPDLCGHVAST